VTTVTEPSPRQVLDELLRRRVEAAAKTDEEGAQLLDAQVRLFADAVDRDGAGIPYGDAVVITGTAGPVVVPLRDYHATPLYWQSCAGEVDLIIDGADVMTALTT
jgi:hypothetical protein